MPIAKGVFIFWLPPHFRWLVFTFLALYRPTDYVYKIWFSLVQGQEFSFFDPPPHFGLLVFAFLALYRNPDYVYKIWLRLLQGQGFIFFSPHPPFGWFLGGIFQTKVVRNYIPYNFARETICCRVNSLGVIWWIPFVRPPKPHFGIKISKRYITKNAS